MVNQDVTYNVQYGTDTEFNPGTFIEIKGLTDTKLYNPVDFIKGELYYWRVYAVTTSNDTIWSDNGNYSQFGISELPSIISGVTDIPANRTIIPENNPYYFVDATVENFFPDTLTIRPGVICQLEQDLHINGHLISEGTSVNRISYFGNQNSIDLLSTSTELVLDDDFSYISGPKFSFCNFENVNIDDVGLKGAYIDFSDFLGNGRSRNRIAYGYVNQSNFLQTHGLEISPDTYINSNIYNSKILRTNFTGNSLGGTHYNLTSWYEGALSTAYQDTLFLYNNTFNENGTRGTVTYNNNMTYVDSTIYNQNSSGVYLKQHTDDINITNSEFSNNTYGVRSTES